jgi:hypothetical protein
MGEVPRQIGWDLSLFLLIVTNKWLFYAGYAKREKMVETLQCGDGPAMG